VNEPRIQFLFFDGCALARRARAALERALADRGIDRDETIDLLGPDTPPDLRGWGSPTILVDGIDATGQPQPEALSCRVYQEPGGVRSVGTISTLIRSRMS
jgi:hypothetical protein